MITDLGLDSYQEPEILPGNEEYRLQCTAAEWKENEKGRYLQITLRPLGFSNVKLVNEVFSHPADAKDTPKMSAADSANLRKRQLIQLQAAFEGANASDANSFIGRECSAILKVESSAQYGDSNRVKTWIKA